MTFQTIFEAQQSMTVNTRRMVGQTYSRAGQVYVAQYLTAVPWVFTVVPWTTGSYKYARQIIQSVDNLDRQYPQNVQFIPGIFSDLSWFTKYQGDFSPTPTGMIVAATPPANSTSIQITNLPTTSPGLRLFYPGDFIEFSGHVYKVTENVWTGGSTLTVPLHRPVIAPVTPGDLVKVGNDVVFNLIAEQCPTYTLNAGPNTAFIQWDMPFIFREYLTT